MRLVSFLGTGDYRETTYTLDSTDCRTRFVAHALAHILRPDEIHVLATEEAWSQHGDALYQALTDAGHPAPKHIQVPTQGGQAELWQLFGHIVEAIRPCTDVTLDITHGFRMQPFFAAACVQYVQAVLPKPPTVRVVYGEFRHDQNSPVWDLSPFLEVLAWSRSLLLFLRTGRAEGIAEPTDRLGRELRKEWANSGQQGQAPRLRELADWLEKFGDDFTTVRTGSLLTGQNPTASRLRDAIEHTREEVNCHIPALGLVLDQVAAMVAPLANSDQLSMPSGQRALLALARLYQQMGRYSEAISVLREGWITLSAKPAAAQPGKGFDPDERCTQEDTWRDRLGDQSRTVSEVRNDIQHAGFCPDPKSRKWFGQQLTKLLGQWEQAIKQAEAGS